MDKIYGCIVTGCAGFLIAVVLVSATPAAAQRDFGRTRYLTGERTTAGSWDGTWIYRNRDQKIALWIREEGGVPQVKLRLIINVSAETLETDWEGSASYDFQDKTSTFALTLESSDEDEIRGRWNWNSVRANGGREEVGTFQMFRVDGGRHLLMEFDSFETIHRNGEHERIRPSIRYYTFTKVSRRHARWDELPF